MIARYDPTAYIAAASLFVKFAKLEAWNKQTDVSDDEPLSVPIPPPRYSNSRLTTYEY